MKRVISGLVCLILVLWGFLFQLHAAQDLSNEHRDFIIPFRNISATQIQSFLKIDGNIDEEEWKKIRFIGNFIQREPNVGDPATEDTKIALLYNQNKLYIAIQCFDKEPNKIIAREMRRDAHLDNDDNFRIVFDTFNDRRNGFYFNINPNGCRRDATFGDEGTSYNSEWNGIWECETQINDKGWFAEIAIPWKTLRFGKGDSLTWGINFSREIRRKNETDFWQLVPRDAGRMGFFRVSQAGTLTGLNGMQAGGNLEIEPYLLSSATKDDNTNFDLETKGNWGFESKFNITSNISMNFTWNTDFAQVEADQERVNLTRFSLYFPEKRDFFLDGAEIFNFGGQSISGRGPSNGIRLFYSRTIGIEDGFQQPINNGVKLFGKSGKYQMGLINVLTDEINIYDDDPDDDDEDENDSESVGEWKNFKSSNFTVFRLRRDILKRSSIGMMFLNKEQIDSTFYNRSVGFDGNFPITDRFKINGSIAQTLGPDYTEDDEFYKMDEDNLAGNIGAAFDSDLLDVEFSHLNIQENFNAEMGYIRRTGIKNTASEIDFSPRSHKFKSIRQYRWQTELSYLTDQKDKMLEAEISSMFGVRFQNGGFIYAGLAHKKEFIDEDWEVRPGFIIPMETYDDLNSFLFMQTDESKNLFGRLRITYGDYFTGTRFSMAPEIVSTSINRMNAEFNFDINYVSLPEGDFQAQTFSCRLYYYFSTKMYLKAYIQFNDDKLNNDGDRISLANLLFRWTYRPGSDFYIVYNDTRLFGASDGLVSNRALMLKLTYFWRK